MSLHLSQRARQVTPFLAMEIMEQAKLLEQQGREIIYLCLGEPDFPTPQKIITAATQAIEAGHTTYTHSLGLLELRQQICHHYLQRYGVTIVPEQVLVSAGTSPLMLLLFAALLDPGDELILTNPGYACYANFIRFNGGTPVEILTRAEDGFQPRPAEVKKVLSPRSRGILINSPSNPTGSLIPTDWLQQLAELDVPIISDEIYHGLTYQGEEHSILEFTDQAFVLGGFSKAYAMTGWRLGYLIAPLAAVRVLQNLHQNFLICASSFIQYAGITALRDCQEDVTAMRSAYDERRQFIVARLRQLGFPIHSEPVGAFYVLADARHLSTNSLALARKILDSTGVAVTPGIDFGSGAEGFLRFSYANSLDKLRDAMDRLEQWLHQR
ncbi:MAG: pyridoxal phosphate-dependent aminotransferase [Desulfuromonas sp.]|nr:pyridoxal phosphate-dependent aminotransferase [Desulfuromonas sp.]